MSRTELERKEQTDTWKFDVGDGRPVFVYVTHENKVIKKIKMTRLLTDETFDKIVLTEKEIEALLRTIKEGEYVVRVR